MRAHTLRCGLLVAALFFVVSAALSNVLPLWLDEILQLIETRESPSAAVLLANVPRHRGAAPLGYLLQQSTLTVTGYSVRNARLPSAVFGAASVLLVVLLAGEAGGVKRPWLAGIVFGSFPIILRYSTESRVYTQALFFSLLATLLYLLCSRSSTNRFYFGFAYGVALIAAIYTLPFAVFVAPAHLLFALLMKDNRMARIVLQALAAAFVAFLPWFIWARGGWASAASDGILHFAVSAKTPLMLFRELLGANYWGSGLAALLVSIALWRSRIGLLSVLIVVPIVLVLATDAVFSYFLAARQFLWILPPLAILITLGAERKPMVGLPMLVMFLAVCGFYSYKFFSSPREDAEKAARFLAAEVAKGACLQVVPVEEEKYYRFFEPGLESKSCADAGLVVLAETPYTSSGDSENARRDLTARGYVIRNSEQVGFSSILYFVR